MEDWDFCSPGVCARWGGQDAEEVVAIGAALPRLFSKPQNHGANCSWKNDLDRKTEGNDLAESLCFHQAALYLFSHSLHLFPPLSSCLLVPLLLGCDWVFVTVLWGCSDRLSSALNSWKLEQIISKEMIRLRAVPFLTQWDGEEESAPKQLLCFLPLQLSLSLSLSIHVLLSVSLEKQRKTTSALAHLK